MLATAAEIIDALGPPPPPVCQDWAAQLTQFGNSANDGGQGKTALSPRNTSLQSVAQHAAQTEGNAPDGGPRWDVAPTPAVSTDAAENAASESRRSESGSLVSWCDFAVDAQGRLIPLIFIASHHQIAPLIAQLHAWAGAVTEAQSDDVASNALAGSSGAEPTVNCKDDREKPPLQMGSENGNRSDVTGCSNTVSDSPAEKVPGSLLPTANNQQDSVSQSESESGQEQRNRATIRPLRWLAADRRRPAMLATVTALIVLVALMVAKQRSPTSDLVQGKPDTSALSNHKPPGDIRAEKDRRQQRGMETRGANDSVAALDSDEDIVTLQDELEVPIVPDSEGLVGLDVDPTAPLAEIALLDHSPVPQGSTARESMVISPRGDAANQPAAGEPADNAPRPDQPATEPTPSDSISSTADQKPSPDSVPVDTAMNSLQEVEKMAEQLEEQAEESILLAAAENSASTEQKVVLELATLVHRMRGELPAEVHHSRAVQWYVEPTAVDGFDIQPQSGAQITRREPARWVVRSRDADADAAVVVIQARMLGSRSSTIEVRVFAAADDFPHLVLPMAPRALDWIQMRLEAVQQRIAWLDDQLDHSDAQVPAALKASRRKELEAQAKLAERLLDLVRSARQLYGWLDGQLELKIRAIVDRQAADVANQKADPTGNSEPEAR